MLADVGGFAGSQLRITQSRPADAPVIDIVSPEGQDTIYDPTIYIEGKINAASDIKAFSIAGRPQQFRQTRQLFFSDLVKGPATIDSQTLRSD